MYVDDQSIDDDDPIWRRIPHWHVVPDENNGGWRASSAAFCDHPTGTPMSVHLARQAVELGFAPADVLKKHPGFSLVSFTAGDARRLDCGVAPEPIDDEIAHGVVFGKKTKGRKKGFAKAASWLVLIEPDQT